MGEQLAEETGALRNTRLELEKVKAGLGKLVRDGHRPSPPRELPRMTFHPDYREPTSFVYETANDASYQPEHVTALMRILRSA